ncbi:Uncharacterised protein [Mycobacterium tuberculosis]|uniref:Uncharacterized protein n=1 Tax=Mycobacterium tuberculosis TaxID=1773 RepID=A0A655FNT9_MYCTX|nr:Uncharacterised protein [Mycobacterium tuberculosis]COV43187.1 Uncharacterised protein [Mycobacterium tuberculosis]COW06795.1 Uncharacterised protein [Mycobacterium tuberculosis]
MAGTADLVNRQQYGVAVTIQAHRVNVLGVAGRRALDPLFGTGSRIVSGLTGLQGTGQGLVVHPGNHQHVTAAPLLDDGGNQSVGITLQPRRDLWVECHRTVIPSAARAAFT